MPACQPRTRRPIRPIGFRSPHYRALPRLFRRQRLLIIGCGDIGQRIAALSAQWRVFGIGRSRETLERIRSSGATPLHADAPRRRLQDLADWVVHSAPPPLDEHRQGGGVMDRLTRRWTARLLDRLPRPLNSSGDSLGPVQATPGASAPRSARGVRLARRAPSATAVLPKRLVYLSTTGVYGDRQGRWTDEVCAVKPITDRARRRVDAEQWLRETAGRATPSRPAALHVTTLRVPGIYAIDRLPIRRLQERLPALLPQADVQTNHIEADDLARMTRIALMRGRSQRRLNVVDDSSLPMADYLDMVARWAGLPLPPRVERETLLTSVSPMRASFMSESRRLCNQRMKRELRLALRYPTVAAFLAANPPPQPGAVGVATGGLPL